MVHPRVTDRAQKSAEEDFPAVPKEMPFYEMTMTNASNKTARPQPAPEKAQSKRTSPSARPAHDCNGLPFLTCN
jgi:hypothetical protein